MVCLGPRMESFIRRNMKKYIVVYKDFYAGDIRILDMTKKEILKMDKDEKDQLEWAAIIDGNVIKAEGENLNLKKVL